MGKRVANKAAVSEQGADDLSVLHPERVAVIAGRTITVREYGFIEGLGLRTVVQPLLDDLHAGVVDGRLPPVEQILGMLGRHAQIIRQLLAVAADVEPQWLDTLGQNDGQLLLMLWWGANGPFYVSSVYQRIASERVEASLRAGPTSTQP